MRIIKEGSNGNTRDSLEFFKEHYHELGEVNYIVLYYAEKEWCINHDLFHQYAIVIGEKAQLWMSGLTWGYYGAGPSALLEVMQMIDPAITYEDIVSLKWMAENPIIFERVSGNLIQCSFDEFVRSLLCFETDRLPWKKLWN